jgi:hypothetical protein
MQAERAPDADPDDHILLNAWGRRYAHASSLSHAIRAHSSRSAWRGDGKRLFPMHGLCKTAAADVAALLVGTQGIKSVGGWKSDSMAAHYAKFAEQRAMNNKLIDLWDAEIERQEEATARRAKPRQGAPGQDEGGKATVNGAGPVFPLRAVNGE